MSVATVEKGDAEIIDLQIADRCDRCGAQAFMIAIHPELHNLLFCAHHGRKHLPALESQGWAMLDYSDRLNEKPSVSANAE